MDTYSIIIRVFFGKVVLPSLDDIMDDNKDITMYYTNKFNLSNMK